MKRKNCPHPKLHDVISNEANICAFKFYNDKRSCRDMFKNYPNKKKKIDGKNSNCQIVL